MTLGGLLCEQLPSEASCSESHPSACALLACASLNTRLVQLCVISLFPGSWNPRINLGNEIYSLTGGIRACFAGAEHCPSSWWHRCPLRTCSKSGDAAEKFSGCFLFGFFFWLRRQDLLQDYLCKQLALCMAINTNLETRSTPRSCL